MSYSNSCRFGLREVILSLFLSLFCCQLAHAVPANHEPFEVRQPDGTKISLRMRGDEWFSWQESIDGHPVVLDSATGFWVYAVQLEAGGVIGTKLRVGLDQPKGEPTNLRPTQEQAKAIVDGRAAASRAAGVTTGTGFVPVILANFSDTTPQVSRTTISNLLFSTSAGAKSMATYFTEVSYGNFTVAAGPSGLQNWVNVPNTAAFYGATNGGANDIRPAQFIRDAVLAAIAAGYNFAPYDQDGDGKVDVVNVVHSGAGQESGGGASAIWSHRWSLTDAGLQPVSAPGGLLIDDYVVQPELGGDGTAGTPINIGVFVHEHGHALGLPDLYDNDYSSCGVGNWSGMSFGANLDSGRTPAHFDAWCKMKLGWLTPINYTLNYQDVPFPHAAGTPFAARLWKDGIAGSQYFLVENRYRTNFDSFLPSSGLLVWHIDESKTGNSREWYPISPGGAPARTNSGNFVVRLVQADGLFQMDITNKAAAFPVSARQNQGDAGDPFPGSANNRLLSFETSPNSRAYNAGSTPGFNSYVVISNISDAGPNMTADLYTRSPNSGPFVEWRNIAGIVPPTEGATFTKLGEFNPVVVKALPGVTGVGLKQIQLYINRGTDGRWWNFSGGQWVTNAVSSNVDVTGVQQNGFTLAYQNNLPSGTNLVNGGYTFIVRVINTSDIVTELQMPMTAVRQPEVSLSLTPNAFVNTLTNFTAYASEDSGVGIQRVEVALFYDTEANHSGPAERWYWDGYSWTTVPQWLGADFAGNPGQATLYYPIGPDAASLVSDRQYFIAARAIDGFGTEATTELSVFFDYGTPPNKYWRYGSSGNWFDAASWIPYGVPGPGDHVAVNQPGEYTVSLSGAANVASLRFGRIVGLDKQRLYISPSTSLHLNGGDTNKFFGNVVLDQGGDLSGGLIRFYSGAKWNWTNGTLTGQTHLDVNSGLTIAGDSNKHIASGSTLLNRGAITWRDAGAIVGYGGPLITNAGLFSFEGTGTVYYNNSGNRPLFVNGPSGLLRKTIPTTNSFHADYGGWSFHNYGAMDIQSGVLLVRSESKVFLGGSVSGAGVVRSQYGNLTLAGDTAFNNGRVELLGNMSGAGAFTGSGTFDWIEGSIHASARITNGPSMNFNISQGGAKWMGGGSIFQQNGTVTVTEPGTVVLSQGSLFSNSGLFLIPTSTTFYYDNSGNYSYFVNNVGGTVRKSSTNTARFHLDYTGIRVSNLGLFEVQGGTLQLGGGGGPSSGHFHTQPGSSIEFTGGTQEFVEGASIIGGGVTRLLGGRVNANSGPGAITLNGTLEISTNGVLGGNATWTGTGTMNWNAGTIQAVTRFGSGLTMNITGSAQRWLEGGSFENFGTINWFDDGLLITSSGASLVNRNIFHAQGTAALYYNNHGNYTAFHNEAGAVFRKSGSGTNWFHGDYTGVAFHNRGNIDLLNGELLMMNGTKVLHGGGTITGPARLRTGAGLMTLAGVTTLSGSTVQAAADVTGSGGFTGNGTFQWISGYIYGGARLTNDAGIHLLISPGSGKFLSTSIIHQNGPSTVTEPGLVVFSNGSEFHNAGNFLMQTNTTFYYDNSGNYTWFRNLPSGVMQKVSTNVVYFHADYSGIRLENDGVIDVQAGVLRLGGGGGVSTGQFNVGTDALIELNAQTQTLGAGSSITGPGLMRLLGGRLDAGSDPGVIQLSGRLEISTNSILGGIGRFEGTGKMEWNAGSIQAQMTLSTGLTMNIFGSAPRWLEGGAKLVNEATINWSGNGDLITGNGAVITNKAMFHAREEARMFYNNSGGYTAFFNEPQGIVRRTGGGTNTFAPDYGGIAFYNRGTVDVQEGMLMLWIQNKVLHTGGIISGAGRLKSTGGMLTLAGTSTFAGGTLEVGGDMNGVGGFAGTGTLNWTAGAFYSVQVTNEASVLLSISPGGGKWMGGNSVWRQTGPSIVTDPGTVTISQGSIFNNAGLFDVRTNTSFFYDNSGGYPEFNNLAGATFRKSGGAGSSAFEPHYGGIRFNNYGTLDLRVGTLGVHGPFNNAPEANWVVTLGGTNVAEFGRAMVSGNVPFNGPLNVVLTNGYIPADGHSFSLVGYGSRSGQFAPVSLPALAPNLNWKLTYLPNALVLEVVKAHSFEIPAGFVNGQMNLNFAGPTASSAILQISTDLVDWLNVATNAPFNGTFQFVDSSPVTSNKFYRVLINP